jgi:hypothetical protein
MDRFEIKYSYRGGNESTLATFLEELEKKVGGRREPYYAKGGAIDLVSFLEITVSFITSQLAKKYVKGFFGADTIQKMAENHRKQVLSFLQDLEVKLYELMINIEDAKIFLGSKFEFNSKEKALVIEFYLPAGALHVVVNHAAMSPITIKNLPAGILSAIQFLAENQLEDEQGIYQLYFNDKHEWNYLFAPTTEGFGRYIDRIIDLRSQTVHKISSIEEFVSLVSPHPDDELKFLVSPFRRGK